MMWYVKRGQKYNSVVGHPYSDRGRSEAEARVHAGRGDVSVRARVMRKRRAPRFLLELEL
jgi:hypothetical protein